MAQNKDENKNRNIDRNKKKDRNKKLTTNITSVFIFLDLDSILILHNRCAFQYLYTYTK